MSNNLKHLREQKGYTQMEFAKMIGVTVSHLNKVENSTFGKTLTLKLALRAAGILGVSLDEIFLK